MVPRRVIAFLLSVVPLFGVLLWLWQSRGVADGYHTALAAVLDLTYPALHFSDVLRGVSFSGGDFVLHLLVDNQPLALHVNAQDLTWNMAMLASLYLASVARHRRGAFLNWLAWFGGSTAALVIVHALTVVTNSREALVTEPSIAAHLHTSTAEVWLLQHYNRFYEELGSQLLVVVMWLPYALFFVREARAHAHEGKGSAE